MWSRTRADQSPPSSTRLAGGSAERVEVLMYHSIAPDPGPTSIPVDVFRSQIQALRDSGYQAISLSELPRWQRHETELPRRTVMITFDDGFADFADAAFPILREHQMVATVFLPTACMGKKESWIGANVPPRPLMSWDTVLDLARQGIEFGGHSVTHADLTVLPAEKMREEIERSQAELAERLGHPVDTFAPPYGRSNPRVRAELRKWCRVAVGTELGPAFRGSDTTDVPRLEMHYFRNPRVFRRYLEGRGDLYLAGRKALRRVRTFLKSGQRAGE
jgi:peptidoglycan/xylan/chitin deacetylase (PgdA/CDA1 family)